MALSFFRAGDRSRLVFVNLALRGKLEPCHALDAVPALTGRLVGPLESWAPRHVLCLEPKLQLDEVRNGLRDPRSNYRELRIQTRARLRNLERRIREGISENDKHQIKLCPHVINLIFGGDSVLENSEKRMAFSSSPDFFSIPGEILSNPMG